MGRWTNNNIIGEAVGSNVPLATKVLLVRASETSSTLSFITILPNKLNGGKYNA